MSFRLSARLGAREAWLRAIFNLPSTGIGQDVTVLPSSNWPAPGPPTPRHNITPGAVS